MAITNQGDGTGVEPGCCRMAMTNHFTLIVELVEPGCCRMAITNHFTPMVRAWNLGVVGWR